MKVSFKGIYLYKFNDEIQRNNIVRTAKFHENSTKNLWVAFDINQGGSYDALILVGKELAEYRALSALKPIGSLSKYMKAVLKGYAEKATVFDFRE